MEKKKKAQHCSTCPRMRWSAIGATNPDATAQQHIHRALKAGLKAVLADGHCQHSDIPRRQSHNPLRVPSCPRCLHVARSCTTGSRRHGDLERVFLRRFLLCAVTGPVSSDPGVPVKAWSPEECFCPSQLRCGPVTRDVAQWQRPWVQGPLQTER